ncbi:hypothetical protein Tco_1046033, partial [Tanacetum coccineum]
QEQFSSLLVLFSQQRGILSLGLDESEMGSDISYCQGELGHLNCPFINGYVYSTLITPLSGCDPDQKDLWEYERGFRGAPRPLLPAMLLIATTNPSAGQEHLDVAQSQPSSSTIPVPSTSLPPEQSPPPITAPIPASTPTPIPETDPEPMEHTFE